MPKRTPKRTSKPPADRRDANDQPDPLEGRPDDPGEKRPRKDEPHGDVRPDTRTREEIRASKPRNKQ